MTDVRIRLQCQMGLRGLVGRRVARASRSIGTSFFLDFSQPGWWLGHEGTNGRWLRPHRTAGRYSLLSEFSDWRLRAGGRLVRAGPLEAKAIGGLMKKLEGARVTNAALVGPNCGFRFAFSSGQMLTVPRTSEGEHWHVGLPFGFSVGPDGVERTRP